MIPNKYGPVLFGLILSGLMSLVVAGISTFRATGMVPGYFGMWTQAWLTAWMFAFPIVLVAAPFVRRAVQYLVRSE
jgi:uncharacterized membrane protein